ncbi:MAG: hypothetical protein H7Z71_10095 [Moraxellaceae bacterium]|nr:hypothetical protein [Pseudobdellovibrionaceae bacterium]
MTIEYVLLLIVGGVVFMSSLMKAPKTVFEEGGVRLASRVETQLATGSGFEPYPGAGDAGSVPWNRVDE